MPEKLLQINDNLISSRRALHQINDKIVAVNEMMMND